MKLFTILDVKANHFLKPMVEPSTAQAMRAFEVAANNPDSTFSMFPDDFALMEIASFDVQTGSISPLPHPVNLGTARSFVKTAVLKN